MALSSRIAMARDWSDLFITNGDRPAVAAQAAAEEPERKRGFFRKLRQNLSKTREALGAEIQATLLEATSTRRPGSASRRRSIMADVGAATTARVVGELEAQAAGGEIVGARRSARGSPRCSPRSRAPALIASTCVLRRP